MKTLNDEELPGNARTVRTPAEPTTLEDPSEKPDDSPPDIENSSSETHEASLPDWTETHQKVSSTLTLIEERLKYDQCKEQAFNQLYEELDALKKDKAFEDIRPLYIDLILLYDRIKLFRGDKNDSLFEILDSIQEELIEILLRRNIDRIEKEDESFDPSFQKIVNTQQVETSDLDGKVLHVLRDGFTYKNHVIRPQEVVVGKYTDQTVDSDSQ